MLRGGVLRGRRVVLRVGLQRLGRQRQRRPWLDLLCDCEGGVQVAKVVY